VRAAGGEDLVRESIWSQVATALERAANGGFDLTDDLPSLVNGAWVARLRLMHDADLRPTGSATQPAPANEGQAARARVRGQTLETNLTKTQSASARPR
jgi:hypothetical protein